MPHMCHGEWRVCGPWVRHLGNSVITLSLLGSYSDQPLYSFLLYWPIQFPAEQKKTSMLGKTTVVQTEIKLVLLKPSECQY